MRAGNGLYADPEPASTEMADKYLSEQEARGDLYLLIFCVGDGFGGIALPRFFPFFAFPTQSSPS